MNRRRDVVIVDRTRLAEVVTRAVHDRCEGNFSAAGRRFGIKQPTMSRLRCCGLGRVRWKTYEGLLRLVPRSQHAALGLSLLASVARESLEENRRWLARQTLGSEDLAEARASKTDLDKELHNSRALERWQECQELLAHLRRRLPDLFKRFDTFLVRHGHLAGRARLAFERIVAPLLQAGDSGFIERDSSELSPNELRRFVHAGIVREEILLRRSPDLQRAQDLAAIPPASEARG
jgi:hypothetical protein